MQKNSPDSAEGSKSMLSACWDWEKYLILMSFSPGMDLEVEEWWLYTSVGEDIGVACNNTDINEMPSNRIDPIERLEIEDPALHLLENLE